MRIGSTVPEWWVCKDETTGCTSHSALSPSLSEHSVIGSLPLSCACAVAVLYLEDGREQGSRPVPVSEHSSTRWATGNTCRPSWRFELLAKDKGVWATGSDAVIGAWPTTMGEQRQQLAHPRAPTPGAATLQSRATAAPPASAVRCASSHHSFGAQVSGDSIDFQRSQVGGR